ncbi:MAG: DUF29 domain-containing protein [Acetobacteraceae bacterium]|nr:DUF29 domain-containing protein [Acetobacteraceae bacterium]
MPSNATLYETDFHAWANEQAALLRAGRLTEADIENIAEEIATLGRNEKRELVTRLEDLLLLVLKWRYQPAFRSGSWCSSIEEKRYLVNDHLKDSPSLRSQLDDAMRRAYRRARLSAVQTTGFDPDTFPPTCPFTFDEAMNPEFWPE